MGKMEATLRSEISRLAKKEVKAGCGPLARQVRELKRTVSRLSKTVGKVERLGGKMAKQDTATKARLEAAPAEVKSARISAGLIKKLRTRLAITQSQLASLINVSHTTVAFWEQGRTRPTPDSKAAIVGLRKLGRRDVKRLLADKEGGRK